MEKVVKSEIKFGFLFLVPDLVYNFQMICLSRAFNIFQVYQYFTSSITYTTLFKIRRYQRPY